MSEWSYTSAPFLCLHGVSRYNCTLFILVSGNIHCRNLVLYVGYTILLKLGGMYVGAYCLLSSCKTLFFLFLSGHLSYIVQWVLKVNMIVFLLRMQSGKHKKISEKWDQKKKEANSEILTNHKEFHYLHRIFCLFWIFVSRNQQNIFFHYFLIVRNFVWFLRRIISCSALHFSLLSEKNIW